MQRSVGFFALAFVFFIALIGCSSAPRRPTEGKWGKPPFWQSDSTTFDLQGDFLTIEAFLETAAKLRNRMTIGAVKKLGFDADSRNKPCERIDWLDASKMILAGARLDVSSADEALKEKKAVYCYSL